MGSPHSKHRIAAGTSGGGCPGGDPAGRWADMDGPSFHCSYLGYAPLAKPPTGLAALQPPVKDLYLKYRKSAACSNSASLKLTQHGVFVLLFEGGVVQQELFLSFASVNLVDAVKFSTIKTSNSKKPKAIFRSIDESKPTLPDKNSFQLDKNVLFLATVSHPPLVVCVVRRPQGVKALDCHVFALDTIENCIHIAGLISSTQITGHAGAPVDSAGAMANPDRHGHSDVIHTEYGEYSVYRGPTPRYEQGIRGPSNYDSKIRGVSSYEHPSAGKFYHGQNTMAERPIGDGLNTSGMTGVSHKGPHILTQDDFLLPQQSSPYVPPEPHVAKTHFSPENIGAFRYDVSGPDLLRGRQISADITEENGSHGSESGSDVLMRNASNNYSRNSGQRFSAENPSNQRYSGESSNQRLASHRLSSGQGPPVAAKPFSPRTSMDSSSILRYPSGGSFDHSQSPRYPSGIQSPDLINPQQPAITSITPRSSVVARPTSPQNKSSAHDEYFSASNLESRCDEETPETGEIAHNGRPVAKVPPHMKGIKVLPSDFMMVKLKPKEDKKIEPFDDDADYDNNKNLMNKYRELQEQTRETFRNQGSSLHNNFPDGRDFRNFEKTSPGMNEVHSYNTNWSDSNPRTSSAKTTPYNAATHNANSNTNPHSPSSTKDAEIANMFSDFSIHGGGKGNPLHRQQRNDFEDGLGYLP